MIDFVDNVVTILTRDLTCEVRTRDVFTAMAVFALLALLVFNFAFQFGIEDAAKVGPSALWVAFIFAGMLGLGQAFARDRDRGSLEGLLLAPVDRSAIFVGKLLGNVVLMFVVEAISLPVFGALFNLPVLAGGVIVSVVLGTLGFAAVGTLFSAVAANTRAREVMLPVLLLPIALPVIVASIRSMQAALDPVAVDGQSWLNVLIAFDVIFLALGFAVFEHTIEG